MVSPIVLAAVLGTILLGILLRSKPKSKLPQPPGPPGTPPGFERLKLTLGLPILGNLLQMPPKHSWLLFKEWADEYGPIFRFTIGGQNNVVVSTEKIANDLLRERGNFYSSREQSIMAAELLSHNLRPLFLPYNGTHFIEGR